MIRQVARIAELERGREIDLAASGKQAERIAGLEKQASDVAMLKQQMDELLAAASPWPKLAATKLGSRPDAVCCARNSSGSKGERGGDPQHRRGPRHLREGADQGRLRCARDELEAG